MKVTTKQLTKTQANYEVEAATIELNKYLETVVAGLASSVKVPGFRPGKAPMEMVLKQADQSQVQNDFLNLAVNDLYMQSQREQNLKVIGEPKISITKFVPFSTLVFAVEVPVIADIKLPSYASLKQPQPVVKVTKEQLDRNLTELQKRYADFKPVKRAIKKGDQAIIDFTGSDPKTKEELPSATSEGYRLIVGDGSLITGFEDNLIGLKPGDTKDFQLTFPTEYPDKSFAGRKVKFSVKVTDVSSVTLPKLDDVFAKKVGPFENLAQLKTELSKQLEAEDKRQATIDLENRILNQLAEKTVVELSDQVIDAEVEVLVGSAKKSALNRGQTWTEFLASLGETEDSYNKKIRETAIKRIRGGLATVEIANREGLTVNDEELSGHLANLKRQYTDPAMQAELEDPNNQQELRMRLLTEKVLDFIQAQSQIKTPTKSK